LQEPAALPGARFGALHFRDFRLFFIGMLVSQVGSQMQLMALNWHIYLLTKSPLALGFIGLARILPIIAFALFGGVFADANDRRRVLLVTQTAMMGFAALLGGLTGAGWTTPLWIYLLAASTSAAMAFDSPARQAMIANLVPAEHLANAVSLANLVRKLGTVLGPTIGGVLIAWKGVGFAYWFNAVSFLAVLAALFLMKRSSQEVLGASGLSLAALGEGLRFFIRSRIIFATTFVDFIATFFASATTLLPIFAQEILRIGPKGLGLLYGAEAVGAVCAGVWLSAAGSVRAKGKVQLWALALYGTVTAAYGASRTFPLTLALLFVAGGADTVSTILRNTVRQETTPDRFRGRTSSVNMIFSLGGPQLGNMEAGLMAS
jgi:MFS family permease